MPAPSLHFKFSHFSYDIPCYLSQRYGTTDGRCGDRVNWKVDGSGVLTITGEGGTYVWYNENSMPWAHLKDSITSVKIEEGVTYLGSYAFTGCERLKTIIFPSTLDMMGQSMFLDCPSIESFFVDSANKKYYTDSDGVLYNKNATLLIRYPAASDAESFAVPDTVKTIMGSAFRDAVHLTEVIIPEGVTSLGDRVFIDCTSLKNVVIPSTVTEVKDMAFSGCTSLESVTFYSKDTQVGKSAFIGASPSLEVHFYSGAPADENDVNKTDPTESLGFIDVSPSDSCYEAVKFVVENDLFNGTSEKTFSPNASMTRAMFVTVLGRYAVADTELYKTPTFSDVKAGEWYTSYVEWAAANGIVNGIGDCVFGVDGEVTVAQACVILARTHAFKSAATGTGKSSADYADAASIPAWAHEGIDWAIANGVYTPSETIGGGSAASRAVVRQCLQTV